MYTSTQETAAACIYTTTPIARITGVKHHTELMLVRRKLTSDEFEAKIGLHVEYTASID